MSVGRRTFDLGDVFGIAEVVEKGKTGPICVLCVVSVVLADDLADGEVVCLQRRGAVDGGREPRDEAEFGGT